MATPASTRRCRRQRAARRTSRDRAATALSLGFVTTFLCDPRPPADRGAHLGGDERGLAVVLGRRLEPAGGRRAEADARRFGRSSRSSTPCWGRSRRGCSSATTSAARHRQRGHRPPVRTADDRRRPDAARALRADVADRHQRRLHADGDRALPDVRHAAVRRPHGAAACSTSSIPSWSRPRTRSARRSWTTFRRVVLPNILPGILSGVALAFAKAVGEFGSLVIITGQPPVQDRGLLRLHLRADRERRLGRRSRRGRRAARDLVPHAARRSAPIRHFATRHDR